MAKGNRLSDIIVAGVDYPAKVKIAEVLDHDVLLLKFSTAESTEQPKRVDVETGELVPQEYYNIDVDDAGVLKTFSTGAQPIAKVLSALQRKIDTGEAELPLLCTFRQEGRTYVVD